MLRRLIRNIRQKPKPVRDHIALGVAGIFTALIFTVWLYHTPAKFSSVAEDQKPAEDTSGFADLFGRMKDQWASVKESVPTEAEISSETEEQIPVVMPVIEATTSTSSAPTMSVAATSSASEESVATTSAPRAIRIVTVSSASSTASTTPESR